MASTEEKAYEIMRELDVSYVLVIFGGLTGYSSDGKSLLRPVRGAPKMLVAWASAGRLLEELRKLRAPLFLTPKLAPRPGPPVHLTPRSWPPSQLGSSLLALNSSLFAPQLN